MQYKKKDINDKIIEAGKIEYREKGYRGGNISSIAERAEVPVGNLYRYFDGKSGLLDAIVKGPYYEVPKEIMNLASIDDMATMSIQEIAPMLTASLVGLFEKYGSEIIILFDKCASTRYEDFSEKIFRLIDELFVKKIFTEPDGEDKLMSKLISKAFVNSIIDLLRKGLDHGEMESIVNRLLVYYFYNIGERC